MRRRRESTSSRVNRRSGRDAAWARAWIQRSVWQEETSTSRIIVGARLFDVSIEGQQVLSSFDIFAEASGANRGIMRSFDVMTTDGKIDIGFGHVRETPVVMAIEIIDWNTVINTAPVVAPMTAQIVTPGGSLSIPVSAVDTDPEDDITLDVLGLPSTSSFMDHGDGTVLISVNQSTCDEGEFPVSVQATSGDQDLTGLTAFELVLSQLIGSRS